MFSKFDWSFFLFFWLFFLFFFVFFQSNFIISPLFLSSLSPLLSNMQVWRNFAKRCADKYANWLINCRNYQDRLDEIRVLHLITYRDQQRLLQLQQPQEPQEQPQKKEKQQLREGEGEVEGEEYWALYDEVTRMGMAKRRKELSRRLSEQVNGLMETVVKKGGQNPYPEPLSPEELHELSVNSGEIDEEMIKKMTVFIDHPDGFQLVVKKSSITHPSSGYGVFLQGKAPPGTVIGFYPGVVYAPPLPKKIWKGNDYIISRSYDGALVDGKRWDLKAEKYRQLAKNLKDTFSILPSGELVAATGPFSRFRNQFAIANHINHPPPEKQPNVFCFGYDFKTTNTTKAAQSYIPNIEDKDIPLLFKNFMPDVLSRSIICVTTTAIENEELYLNYRYNPRNRYPDWYVEPNPEEAKRRWGPMRMFYPLK